MSDFFLPEGLRQNILKLQNIKIENKDDESLTDEDVNNIAESIVKAELESENGNSKTNMDKRLSDLEKKFYLSKLAFVNGIMGSRGLPTGAVAGLSVAVVDKLVDLGVIELSADGSKITKFNKELASKILGKDVNTWNEFYNNVVENSYGYYSDNLNNLPSKILSKYFIGPILEYESEIDKKKNNYIDLRYTLNQNAIAEDFEGYPYKIESPDDLQKALEWKANQDNSVNGEIDEWVEQGGTGDCWLISAVLALSSTNAGRQILKNAIQVSPNGDVTVTFIGLKDNNGNPVSYTVTKEEILAHNTDWNASDRYTNGDNDMLAMELAVEKLEYDIKIGKIIPPNNAATNGTKPGEETDEYGNTSYIEGGFSERLIFFLTGVVSDVKESDINKLLDSDGTDFSGLSSEELEQILNKAADGDTALTFGLYPDPDNVTKLGDNYYSVRIFTDMNGKEFKLHLPINNLKFDENGNPIKDKNGNYIFDKDKEIIGHALIITNVDKENRTVTIVNPWDSTDEYVFTWEQFTEMGIFSVTSTDLSGIINSDNPVDEIEDNETTEPVISFDSLNNANYASYSDMISAIAEIIGDNNIDKVTVKAEKQSDGTFKITISFTDGENSTEATVTISKGEDNEVSLIKNDALLSKYSNVLKSVSEDKAIETYKNLIKAENGDVAALVELRNCGLPVTLEKAVEQVGFTYIVKATINGEEFTFKFSGDKTDALIDAGLLDKVEEPVIDIPEDNKDEVVITDVNTTKVTYDTPMKAHEAINDILNKYKNALKDYYTKKGGTVDFDSIWNLSIFAKVHTEIGAQTTFSEQDIINLATEIIDFMLPMNKIKADSADPLVFNSLEEAIKKLNLRPTSCPGVYCELHNPNKPAGDYSEQRHYVWDPTANKMIEIPGVYFINSKGQQAKGKDGYEQICAYQQGYSFTDKPGVYEKGGKKYRFNKISEKFELILEFIKPLFPTRPLRQLTNDELPSLKSIYKNPFNREV